MKKIALFGTGFIGRVHARNLASHPDVNFCAVYDIETERAQDISKQYNVPYADRDAIFNSDADAILIATSTNTHADIAERAVSHKKAIFCEKPIDMDVQRVRDLHRTVSQSGVIHMVDFNRRFDPSHNAVKENIVAGEIGDIELAQLSCRTSVAPPIDYIRISGGQMLDQTIHFFDLMRWLTKSDPVRLHAMGAALASKEIGDCADVDTSIVSLQLPSGALVQIDSIRRTSYGYDEKLEVCGSKGLAVSERQQHRHMTVYKKDAIQHDGLYSSWFTRMEHTYYTSLDHFVRSLHGEELDIPNFEDGLKAQIIAAAATESLKSGKAVDIQYD